MGPITIELLERGLTLTRPGGRPQYANYQWLRDNCPTSWDSVTRDRTFDITTLPVELTAHSADVEGDHLVVRWGDGTTVSRYGLAWLEGWLHRPGRDDPAAIKPMPWRCERQGDVECFDLEDVLSDWATRCRYLEVLLRDGLVLVEHLPESDESVRQLAEVAGVVRAGFSGQYFNVRTYPRPAGSAYTANALEPHTDNPCEESPPTIQYLHCLRNDATGGQSTFSDGLAATLDFRVDDPEGFSLLSRLDIPFRFVHDGIDMRARQPVILCDAAGNVIGVNVSQHMADVFDLDQAVLDRYYPAFITFLQRLRSPAYEISLTLGAGQCVVFDNQRIVHGRRAFDPTSGSRHLRGCYSDRGELRSRYRSLRHDGAICDHKPQGAD